MGEKLYRNEDVQQKLQAPDCRWDLVMCDEAHKLSATFFGGEIKYTKRYKLGQLLATLTRNFLLMTATPHNGKEEDFQLFLATLHAVAQVVPEHLQEVRGRRLTWIDKTRAAVKDRLTKEIGYWDHRAADLKLQEQAGKANARLNSQEASRRADELQARLQKRMEQLDLEAQISALPPVVLGGLVVVPAGLIVQMTGVTRYWNRHNLQRRRPGPPAPVLS